MDSVVEGRFSMIIGLKTMPLKKDKEIRQEVSKLHTYRMEIQRKQAETN